MVSILIAALSLVRLQDDFDKETKRTEYVVNVRFTSDPATPPDPLARRADDPSPDIREGVAKHRNTPTDVLADLVPDDESTVRAAVASNRNAPAEALSQLVDDTDIAVSLAPWSEFLPAIVLTDLASDSNAAVRQRVAEHQNTPDHVLKQLACDDIPDVRKAAIAKLRTSNPIDCSPGLRQ